MFTSVILFRVGYGSSTIGEGCVIVCFVCSTAEGLGFGTSGGF